MTEFGGVPLKENKKSTAPRRAVLDLAPLELDCMNTLWPVGEGTVRDIRDRLAERRPRAYTTIMTIMDRLARKGIVERRKVGRAYIYRPNLTAEEARSQALAQVIDSFFGGSKEALLSHVNGAVALPAPAPRALAAAAGIGATSAAAASPVSSSVAAKADTPSANAASLEAIDGTIK
jgi:BlaI family transcriptional regulator, penicillinase repressor